MKKRRLGNSDLYVSEIGLGCMSLGTDYAKAENIVHEALDSGINYLDTADLYDYGQNEEIVGQAVKGRRDDVIIGSKVGNKFTPGEEGWTWDPSKKHIKEGVKSSLKRLGVDYIDLYQLHGGTIEDPVDESIQAFDELVDEGLVRAYGISSIRPNVIKQYVEKSNIVSIMMQYNALDRRPEELLDYLAEHDISVLARGPLAKGMLSSQEREKAASKAEDGYLEYSRDEVLAIAEEWPSFTDSDKNAEALALQYVLHHPAVASAVFGARTTGQLADSLTYRTAPALTNETYRKIQSLTKPLTYQKHRS
ncbi:aldo/keto reductase [Halobacillus kuroshimensis]|uniref:aldo/keto reductase n=1 Tax=Halobacillus kuroshimensis TaxID=302481 RepID=UPI0004888B4B|nr:aldo/keto reductase [Halobacillus kuroshimensis]